MTKKESELLKVLQKEFADAVKKDPIEHRYSVALKTSDPNYDFTLIPATLDDIGNLKYTIYYTSNPLILPPHVADLDGSKVYYCKTLDELQELSKYILVHPDFFNPDTVESSDIMDHPEFCYCVGDVDEYLEDHSDYNIADLYEEYNLD